MRYRVLACDYDGTIAKRGKVSPAMLAALQRVSESGRRLVLVTGRVLSDLKTIFSPLEVFDRVVAENGALLYDPRSKEEHLLTEAPDPRFLEILRRENIPFECGRTIIASRVPHERAIVSAIRESGLELQVIFNKGAIMVLPAGVNKGTGLSAALREMKLSPHNVVGIGDAENDHAFLRLCECSVAVANALDAVKERAEIVTEHEDGDGAAEIAAELVASDLARYEWAVCRSRIVLGRNRGGQEIFAMPYRSRILIAGPSGSGKSSFLTALLEKLGEQHYQFCVIDPEGDYQNLENAVTFGDAHVRPVFDEVLRLVERFGNPVVNMLGCALPDRPEAAMQLLRRLLQSYSERSRPHWIILDEAHHLFPKEWHGDRGTLPQNFGSEVMITVHPGEVARQALSAINIVVAVGKAPERTLREFAEASGASIPAMAEPLPTEGSGEVLVWFRDSMTPPFPLLPQRSRSERRRHSRKYAEGDMEKDSFFFRGPEGKLRLRAQNLALFIQLAEGVDDDTWQHHLNHGDYSAWIRRAIRD